MISEDLTLGRRVFYCVFFGAILLFALNEVNIRTISGAKYELLGMAVFAAICYVMLRTMFFDVVDEVYDCGNKLLIRHRGREDYVPFSNIAEASFNNRTHPSRLTMHLRSPCVFGTKIVFLPKSPFTLNPFARNAIADELIERIETNRGSKAV